MTVAASLCMAVAFVAASPILPVDLRCEYLVEPLNVDTTAPRLSWTFQCEGRDQRQAAYHIQVSASREALLAGNAELWDSGKVDSSQSIHVAYSGKPLHSRQRCFWRVRAWDRDGQRSDWSAPSEWTIGILRPEEWRSPWITASNSWTFPQAKVEGYHSAPETVPDVEKWVQVELPGATKIDAVILHPAEPVSFRRLAGFGFPPRFKIEVSDDPAFSTCRTIADHIGADYGPVGKEPRVFACDGTAARYVRITATRLWNRESDESPYYCFALGALEVVSDGKNVALNQPTTVKDEVDSLLWDRRGLTDERNLPDSAIPRNLSTKYAALLLRTDARLSDNITRAVATVCGIGYYELYLNGTKVGDHVLDPGFTNFSRRVQYVSYDVTDMLHAGDNAVGVILGNGWRSEPSGGDLDREIWTGPPVLKLEIALTYADSKTARITSDANWRWSTGEILHNCIRAGEIIDARSAKPGWDRPGYDDRDWPRVKTVPGPAGKLVAQTQPPIRVAESITPVAITEPKPHVYVVDMGQNLSGWARMTFTGKPGQMVSLHHNERLNPDGTLSGVNGEWFAGPFQRDVFIASGAKDEVFEPRFTYHGYRYIQIEGLDEKPTPESIVGRHVHTDPDTVGEFSCSNELINAEHEISMRTIFCNLHSIPTDCPHREKAGWLQDGCIAAEAAMCNWDMATFYTKWFHDMVDTQESSGYVAPIAPGQGWTRSLPGDMPGWASGPWWSGACVRLPWRLYQYYGDARILEEGYPAMKAYVEYLTAHAEDHCSNFGLGDWLEEGAVRPKRTPPELTNTAAYGWYAQIVSDTARLLGRDADAEHYAALAVDVGAAFVARFLDPDKGLRVEDSQTGPAVALRLGMIPEAQREIVERQLVESIHVRKDHISAGIVGALYVMEQLSADGEGELAYTVATQTDYSGWGHMVAQGATTIWEWWAGIEGSQNHPAFASVDAWFYRALAGIAPDPAAPGFERIVIRPGVVGDLTWAKASYRSVRGRIVSSWKREGDSFALDVTIPVNTRATVYVPSANVRESGRSITQAEGVKRLREDGDWTALDVGSGDYHFTARMD